MPQLRRFRPFKLRNGYSPYANFTGNVPGSYPWHLKYRGEWVNYLSKPVLRPAKERRCYFLLHVDRLNIYMYNGCLVSGQHIKCHSGYKLITSYQISKSIGSIFPFICCVLSTPQTQYVFSCQPNWNLDFNVFWYLVFDYWICWALIYPKRGRISLLASSNASFILKAGLSLAKCWRQRHIASLCQYREDMSFDRKAFNRDLHRLQRTKMVFKGIFLIIYII